MAKSNRHKRQVAKKHTNTAARFEERQKRLEIVAHRQSPYQWTREPSWRQYKREGKAATIDRIINTFELLENVLSHLGTEDIWNMRKICFKAKSTVEQSKELYQKLFKAPTEGKVWKLETVFACLGEPQYIKVLDDMPPPDPPDLTVLGPLGRPAPPPLQRKVVNPLVFDTAFAVPPERRMEKYNDHALVLDIGSLLHKTALHKMFLTQPPTTSIKVEWRRLRRWRLDFQRSGRWMSTPLENADGITLGDLLTEMTKLRAESEENTRPRCTVQIVVLDGFVVSQEEANRVEADYLKGVAEEMAIKRQREEKEAARKAQEEAKVGVIDLDNF